MVGSGGGIPVVEDRESRFDTEVCEEAPIVVVVVRAIMRIMAMHAR